MSVALVPLGLCMHSTLFPDNSYLLKKNQLRNLLFQDTSPAYPKFGSGPVFCDSEALCPYRCPGAPAVVGIVSLPRWPELTETDLPFHLTVPNA